MHYFIDGYNLLFRMLHGSKDLQSDREMIIHDLNKKISLIQLDVSVVFDAPLQTGEGSRSHYDALEILYTAQGETADDYILDEIQNSLSPQEEIVVTSDKKLAHLVRLSSGRTESVEEFMKWLNRSYKNKIKPLRKEKKLSRILTLSPEPQSTIPSKNAPLDAYTDYYAQHFEAKWEEIQKKERVKQELLNSSQSLKRPPRKPRQKKDPFELPLSPESTESSEMERWLKVFEKRSKNT